MARADKVIRGAHWAEHLRQCLAGSPADAVTWMEQHTQLLKSDLHSRVGLLDLQQQPCCLKLYLAKSRWQQLAFRLGLGRGARSFDAAAELIRHGLSVPAPRACLLVPEGMLLLTEGIPDSRDLRALWLSQPAADRVRQLMQCAGHTLAALHRAGYAHGDCKWSNLLWDGKQFYLVDLEAVINVGHIAGPGIPLRSRQFRDLARFTIDAEELGASQQQYDTFLHSYCTGINCARERLAAGITSAAEPIRRRHANKYGTNHRPLH